MQVKQNWHHGVCSLYCRDAEEAEAAACRKGITLAAQWPKTHMVLKTDCDVVAAKLNNTDQDRSVGWSLVHESQIAMEELSGLDIVKIGRCHNNVAHELAHFTIRSGHSEVFFLLFLSLFCLLSVMILLNY